MLTQLATVKTRLAMPDIDLTFDAILDAAIRAASARFDLECRRILARTIDAEYEFPARDTAILVPCYPIESITRFETKTSEAEGWTIQPDVTHLLRRKCVIALERPLGGRCAQARVIYTGGYVLPGSLPVEGQTLLPTDLENAAVEQVTFWFQNRDRLGLSRSWDYHATYRHFGTLDLLPCVERVLARYRRP
jgi:hypothetical protein